MLGFGQSSLNFRLHCWTRMQDWVSTASDLYVAIEEELKTTGVRIPFPQRDLHVRSHVALFADRQNGLDSFELPD